MAVPDASGAPLMDRDPIHSNLKNSKHSSHRRRSRKHFPLSTMPHSHRGKRKLQLDLESEWDYTDTTPWIEGASDDYSSLESNCCNLREQNPATLPNLRKLCEDFSFSLDSLNDNLGTQPPSPQLTNVTTLYCPFASTVKEALPSISIQETELCDKGPPVNHSDYESEADEEEESHDFEEETPLIIDSDCTGDDDSLHEFVTCCKYSSPSQDCHPTTSPSAIPFRQVTSVATVSASNSYDSIPTTTSSNESLRTISSFSNSSTSSSEFFPCPENYDMLYRNFEIAAKMEESKNSENIEKSDQTSSGTSPFSSNVSSGSSTVTRKGENLIVENTENSSASSKVTTFAKLADSRNRSPDSGRELTSLPLHGKTITHWTEVLSKQCHSSKSSPESGINSPIDQSPDSPKVKRPHFLPLQLRHIQRPSAKPNTNSVTEPGQGLLRTLSAPGGFADPTKLLLNNQVLKNDPTYKSDKLNPAIEETDETPEGEKGDLIDWSQTVRPPLQSSVSVNEKCSKPAPLIDWEDVFTSRQSFCEFDSPGKKPALPSTNSTADINANFSITSDVRAWLNGSKHLEDKGIMTSPLQIKDCPCSRTNFQFSSNAKPQRTLGGSLPKRSVYALPLHSVDDFSDDDSLSSLESLEMDDSVFRESLYSLSSEHLYQSQTFTQVTDEIYEDSLCEDAPSHRQPLFDPEPIEDAITQLDFKGSMLSSCFRNIHSQKNNIPVCSSDVLPEAESTSPGCEKDPALDLLSSPIKPSKDSLKIQPEGLYQLNFVSKETPVKYIKHKPLKPIHQVDAEYRCRKALEQLTKPSQSQSAPPTYHNTRPQTLVISTNSTLEHPVVSSRVKDDEGTDWQEDILDALPPQEMRVSPKSSERKGDFDHLDQKRDLVLTIRSAVEQVQECFQHQVIKGAQPSVGNINQLVAKTFCPAIEDLVKDGMKPYSSSWLMGRVKNTSWLVIQATTELGPGTRALNDLFNTISRAGIQQQSSLRFNAFVMGLLNEDLLCDWLEHCRDHPNIMKKYYEPLAFFNLCNSEPYNDLFTELLTVVRQLSSLHFRLDYFYESHLLEKESQSGDSTLQTTGRQTAAEGNKGRPSLMANLSTGSTSTESKLASSVWNFYGKVKSYASQSSAEEKSKEDRVSRDQTLLDRRGECDGKPAEDRKLSFDLDESVNSNDSSETRWSISWIQGFANTVTSPSPQLTSSDDSQRTPSKTWGQVFKSSKWGSGFTQMMPRMKWKSNQTSPDDAQESQQRTSPAAPPLYERHISGCGTPVTGGQDMVIHPSPERGFYSSIRTRVKTRCHYVSLNPGELSFMKGDILTVRGQTSDEWLVCSIGPDSGLVHVDYIQELK